jgi:hypothetical protein
MNSENRRSFQLSLASTISRTARTRSISPSPLSSNLNSGRVRLAAKLAILSGVSRASVKAVTTGFTAPSPAMSATLR